jgi:hypothetical protein
MLDTEEEVNVARKRLGATALVFDHFSLSPPNCNSKLCLVVSREDAYERARRLIDLGMPPMDVMFIDLPSHLTLAKMTKRKDFQAILNSLLKDPRNPLLLDHVRPLVQWESPTPPEFVPCGEEAIGDGLNWQLPSITTWVGDCRSDASTLATLFALKQMLTPKGAVDVVVEVPASSAKASRARTGSSVLWSSVEARITWCNGVLSKRGSLGAGRRQIHHAATPSKRTGSRCSLSIRTLAAHVPGCRRPNSG